MSVILEALKRAERSVAAKAEGDTQAVGAVRNSPSRSSIDVHGVDVTISAKSPICTSEHRQQRRKQKRAGVKLAARVRAADWMDGNFDEVVTTVNASRQDLYFTTSSGHYNLGMPLRVTFPYHCAHDNIAASEDHGEVTRIERLADNRLGVAVLLRRAGETEQSRPKAAVAVPPLAAAKPGERRLARRRGFSAAATVIDRSSGMRLDARCSDLSLAGCYLDTLNPLPNGTLAHVQLRRGDRVFESVARVNSRHVGMGMGLGFHELTREQAALLSDWLSSEQGERLSVAASSPAIPTQAESLDRTKAVVLVRRLLRKGTLTKEDLSTLIAEFVL